MKSLMRTILVVLFLTLGMGSAFAAIFCLLFSLLGFTGRAAAARQRALSAGEGEPRIDEGERRSMIVGR